MLPTLYPMLESLSSSRAPQLVVSLVLAGVVSLVVSDQCLAILAFLVQRLSIIVLLWSIIGAPLAATSMITWVAIAFIYYGTEWRLRRVEMREPARTKRGWLSLAVSPFRALAALLGVLVVYGLVKTYDFLPLPTMLAFTIVWLIANSLLTWLLADSALCTGLGILTFGDGCRILYALWQPNPLVWGLWNACDALVALAISYLRNAEVMAAQGLSESSKPGVEALPLGGLEAASATSEAVGGCECNCTG